MSRYPWRNGLSGLAASRNNHCRNASHQRRSVRLMLERLEDRVVPSGGNPAQQLLVPSPNVGGGAVAANAAAAPQQQAQYSVIVAAQPATSLYRPNGVPLTANVTAFRNPDKLVNAGTVTFTVLDSNQNTITTADGKFFNSFVMNKTQVAVFAATSRGLGNLPVGTYTIKVSYKDNNGTFTPINFKSSTLTITPRVAATTAFVNGQPNFQTPFSRNPKTLTLTAVVSDTTQAMPPLIQPVPVNQGIVGFTIINADNGVMVKGGSIGNIKVKNGAGSAKFILPGGLAPGTYIVSVSYTDIPGNFVDTQIATATITINPGKARAMANPVQESCSPNSQFVALTANVTDTDDSSEIVDEGTVTFTTPFGSDTVDVVNGVAKGSITIPGNEPPGSYAIDVSYSDGSGDYVDSGDTDATLTITKPNCAATSAATANQMAQNLFTYISNLETQLFQSAQAVLNTFSAVSSGQQPLSDLAQELVQYYEVAATVEELVEAPVAQAPTLSPEAFAATGGGETFAAASPNAVGD